MRSVQLLIKRCPPNSPNLGLRLGLGLGLGNGIERIGIGRNGVEPIKQHADHWQANDTLLWCYWQHFVSFFFFFLFKYWPQSPSILTATKVEHTVETFQ